MFTVLAFLRSSGTVSYCDADEGSRRTLFPLVDNERDFVVVVVVDVKPGVNVPDVWSANLSKQ